MCDVCACWRVCGCACACVRAAVCPCVPAACSRCEFVDVCADIELRGRGEKCPNEDEFWAYRVMTMIEGSLRELELPLLPMDVRCGRRLLHALQVRVLFETGQHTRFFRTAENSDYLVACLMHAEFNRMRFVALSQFANGGAMRHVDIDWLRSVLRFEDAGHVRGVGLLCNVLRSVAHCESLARSAARAARDLSARHWHANACRWEAAGGVPGSQGAHRYAVPCAASRALSNLIHRDAQIACTSWASGSARALRRCGGAAR